MPSPGLVIFDCDGVLVDSEPISMRVLTEAINAVGVAMSEAEVHAAFMGGSLEAIEREIALRRGAPLPPRWMEEFLAVRARAFDAELQPVEGAREAVEGVRALGWETCVASQGRPSKMRQTLGLTGLHDAFAAERIFSATMVRRGKPAPDLYLHAAATCGVEPDRCVVVEDSPTGVRGARAAGMRVLAYVAPGRTGDEALALAAHGAEVFHDMREVPERVAA
jgi:HAD superfamily hydrolase (TIGR01509 family)